MFTGPSVGSLTSVAQSWQCPTRVAGGFDSCATFNGTAGTTYYFRADGAGSATGPAAVTLFFSEYCPVGMGRLVPPSSQPEVQAGATECSTCPVGRVGPDVSNGCAPENDNFGAATPVALGVAVNGTTEGGTWQGGEPLASGGGVVTSVWYKFTASGSGTVTVSVSNLACSCRPGPS